MVDANQGAAAAASEDQTNFMILKDYFRTTFVRYFKSIASSKTLIIDESLLKVVAFVLGAPPRETNIAETNILTNKRALPINAETVIFVCRPELSAIE